MRLQQKLPEEAGPHDHFVQFYGRDHRALVANVGRFFRVGLRRGEGLLAIATLEHCDSFARELSREPRYQPAVRDGRIMFFDAELVLAQSTKDGKLVLEQLETLITSALEELRQRSQGASIRVFGEMVGVLWQAGKIDKAVELEECWKKLVQQHDLSLFCGYPIDLPEQRDRPDRFSAILDPHTHLISG